jgi:hypothetical protein
MGRYECTLDEAQKRIGAVPISPLDQSNRILMRELNWIGLPRRSSVTVRVGIER